MLTTDANLAWPLDACSPEVLDLPCERGASLAIFLSGSEIHSVFFTMSILEAGRANPMAVKRKPKGLLGGGGLAPVFNLGVGCLGT